jgi:hypothetical protein
MEVVLDWEVWLCEIVLHNRGCCIIKFGCAKSYCIIEDVVLSSVVLSRLDCIYMEIH